MMPEQGLAGIMADLWERHRGTNLERVAVLEDLALATFEGDVDDNARSLARREAHKLAGSLGTFGFHDGSRLARAIESLLDDERPDPWALTDTVAALARELDPSLAEAVNPISQEPAESYEEDTQAEAAPTSTGLPDRHHIVVVSTDDTLIGRLIAAAGDVNLTVVDSAAAACALVESSNIHAVVVDLDVPEDRIGLFEEAVSTASTTRFVAITDKADPLHRLRVASSGGHGFFPRSLPARLLLDLVVAAPTPGQHSGASILAVDDDPSQLDALELVLGSADMTVTTLTDPVRFWETLEHTRPDVVILDLDMPEIGGLSLCRMVRNDFRWHRLPVIVLTAGHDASVIGEAFEAGADDYVAKPIMSPQFEARIAAHVERHRLSTRLTDVDPLCGVSNRRSAEQSLSDLIHLTTRHPAPMSVAMVDLDHFRQVNTRGGHLVGDAVLRATANLMRERVREEDVVGRWGGEEFILGFYGLTSAVAVERITEMLDELSSLRFTDLDGRDFAVTFSAGVAELPPVGGDLQSLVGAADAALYRAKTVRATVHAAASCEGAEPEIERADVVVVDDDPTLADLLTETLRARGLAVCHLSDGLVAADRLGDRTLRARVVLLDVGLPGLDGFSVLRRLRDRGVLDSTHVVMLTGRSGADEVVRALELGASDHVSKPFSLPVVLERISSFLGT